MNQDILQPQLPQISIKFLKIYCSWNNIIRHIPKIHRYSIGIKIDVIFCDIIELISIAQFSIQQEKSSFLKRAITKNDVLKFLFYTLYEIKGIDAKNLLEITSKLEEIGKMLYGWKNQSDKQKEKTT